MNTTIRPYRIEISHEQIAELRRRLAATRWPQPVDQGFTHGQALSLVRELAAYWAGGFDWHAQEARLNSYPQFLTEIDDQTVHFIHVKSKEPNAFPLILTHGWPSSPAEFLDVMEPLTDPRSHGLDASLAFDLVIPSVPGMGLSSPLAATGWDAARTATAWDTLMKRLGYGRYGAHGGDVGSLIGRELGIQAPKGLVGVHVLQVFAFPTGAPGEMEGLSAFEMEGFKSLENFRKYGGYADIQSKRPGTLAYGLVDSPAALLAWNAELFFGFEGERAAQVDRDRFLTHVSLYWFTATGGQAAEFYLANATTARVIGTCPTTPPRRWPSSPRTSARSASSCPARTHVWYSGPRCREAATSPTKRTPNSSSTTCAASSARCRQPASLMAGPITEQERMADSPLSLTFSQGVPRSVEDDRRFWIGPERFEVPDFDNVEHLVAALARKGVLERDPVVLRASRVDKGFRRTARLLEDRQSS